MQDERAWFLLSELLGEHYADVAALDVVRRLRSVCPEGPRSLLAHSLQHMITDSSDPELVRQATAELQDMKQDSSDVVRVAVAEHLRIVAARQNRDLEG
jgi:hypothetical protein